MPESQCMCRLCTPGECEAGGWREGRGRGGVLISPSAAMQCLIALLVVISLTTAGGWDTVSSSVVLSSCSLICQDSDNGCVAP